MIFWPWFKPNKGLLFVMLVLMSGALFALHRIQSKHFHKKRNQYPADTVGIVETYQPTAGSDRTCVPSETPYSAQYTVDAKNHRISLGCAPPSKLHLGQPIRIWHSKEDPQLAMWAESDLQEPSPFLLIGSVVSFLMGVLILFKGDRLLRPFPDL